MSDNKRSCVPVVARVVLPVLLACVCGHRLEAGDNLARSTQIFRVDMKAAIEGVKAALEDIGAPVLAVDSDAGIVVSKTLPIARSDLRTFGQMDPDEKGTYTLVVYCDREETGTTRISIVTIIRRSVPAGDTGEAGCYLSGNVLTGRLFERLKSRLGAGLLVPVGE